MCSSDLPRPPTYHNAKKTQKRWAGFRAVGKYMLKEMLSKDLTPNISTHKALFWVFTRDFTPIDVGVLSTLPYEPFLSTGAETGPRKLQEHVPYKVPYKYLRQCRYVPGALLALSAANNMSQHVTAIFATSFTIRCGGGCWNKRIIKNPPQSQKKGQTH